MKEYIIKLGKRPFRGINPLTMRPIFKTDAETGYSWRMGVIRYPSIYAARKALVAIERLYQLHASPKTEMTIRML